MHGKHLAHKRLKTEQPKTSPTSRHKKQETSKVQLFNLHLSVHQVAWYHDMVLKSEFLGLAYMSDSMERAKANFIFNATFAAISTSKIQLKKLGGQVARCFSHVIRLGLVLEVQDLIAEFFSMEQGLKQRVYIT